MIVNPSPLTLQGGLLKYSTAGGGLSPKGGTRGTVGDDVSRGSLRRLSHALAVVDIPYYLERGIPLYEVTLTTGPEFWEHKLHIYESFARFSRWLHRQDGFEGFLVRRELSPTRGMVHYHLLVIGVRYFDYDGVRGQWKKCLRARRTQRVTVSRLRTVNYAKYMTKWEKYLAKPSKAVGGRSAVAASGGNVFPNGKTTDSGQPGAAEGHGSCISLSNVHNSTVACEPASALNTSTGDGRGCTGGRWWYRSGKVKVADRFYLQSDRARSVAMNTRRTYRKLVRARKLAALRRKGNGWSRARRELRKWERRKAFRFWRSGLWGRGFSIMAGPEVLSKCIRAGVYSTSTTLEVCLDVWQGKKINKESVANCAAWRSYDRGRPSWLNRFQVTGA